MVRRDRNPPAPAASATAAQSQKVRQLWAEFEHELQTIKQTIRRDADAQLQVHDKNWSLEPAVLRQPREEYEKERIEIKARYISAVAPTVHERWHERLRQANLKDDAWGHMSEKEMKAVEAAFTISSSPPPPLSYSPSHDLPSSLPSPASTSSFTFVNPASFADDDDDDENESGMHNLQALALVQRDGVLDDMFTTTPVQPYSRSGSYAEWGLDSSASSAKSSMHSSATSSLVSSPSAVSRHLDSFSSFSEDKKAARSSHTSQKYIGPVLSSSSPPPQSADEEDFENYKMEIRELKIKEFHAEAAEADIQLYRSIQTLRRRQDGFDNKDGEKQMIAEHEQRMLQLRRTKDEERKVVVDAERRRRREEMLRKKEEERREHEIREREEMQQLQLLQLPTPRSPPEIPLSTKPVRRPVLLDQDRTTPMPSSTMPGSFDLPSLSITPTPASLVKKSGWKTSTPRPAVVIPQEPISEPLPQPAPAAPLTPETPTPTTKKGKAAARKSKLSQVASALEPAPAPLPEKIEPVVVAPPKAEPEPAFTMTKVGKGKQKGKKVETIPEPKSTSAPAQAPVPAPSARTATSTTSSFFKTSESKASIISPVVQTKVGAPTPKVATAPLPSAHISAAPLKVAPAAPASKVSTTTKSASAIPPPAPKLATAPLPAPSLWKVPAREPAKVAPAPAPAPAPPTAPKEIKTVPSSSSSTSTGTNFSSTSHQVWLPKGHSASSSISSKPKDTSAPAPNSVKKTTSSASAASSASTSTSAPTSHKKKVTLEEVADEESLHRHSSQDTLPANSSAILEPKPLVPQTAFSSIIDYEEKGKAPAKLDKAPSNESGKQVRWTPQVSLRDIDDSGQYSSSGGTIRASNGKKKAAPAINDLFATFQPPSPPSPLTSPDEPDDLQWFAQQALAANWGSDSTIRAV
ncbi:hypothetical protein DL96DRAFT_1591713 [Flagelloscypha sp. PMI_526]|nr:hypothetical protein DL96DRAFT_1591713 [Flagelloscypha sp. PMI_526]